MTILTDALLVALGGACGAVLRFLVSRWTESTVPNATFPFATLGINILGCLLIGIFAALSTRFEISSTIRLLIVTGVLGGFTTFSAFGLETITLLRSGHLASALTYVFASVAGGCCAVILGLSLVGLRDTSIS